MSVYEWNDDALCATLWPDAPWVDQSHVDPVLRRVCIHACPVRIDCARMALRIEDQTKQDVKVIGLWAGVYLAQTSGRETAIAELRRIAEHSEAFATS